MINNPGTRSARCDPCANQSTPMRSNPRETMDALIYIANGLYLLSYGVRDILYLRLLTVTAATCLTVYFGSRAQPLMEVVYWNLLFVLLNTIQIGRILHARRRLNTGPVPEVTTGAAA